MDKTISVSTPKMLARDEFENLRGTALYETMVRNRCTISVTNTRLAGYDESILSQAFTIWLGENCRAFHHFNLTSKRAYFEDENELIHFKLFFEGKDIADFIPEPEATEDEDDDSDCDAYDDIDDDDDVDDYEDEKAYEQHLKKAEIERLKQMLDRERMKALHQQALQQQAVQRVQALKDAKDHKRWWGK